MGQKVNNVKRFIPQHLSGEKNRKGGVWSVPDSIFNCIPQFRDEIRLEILRTTRSSKGEKHEFDVTTSCSFPLMKLDGRFKFTRPRIFLCYHFDHPCLIDNETVRYPLRREKFRMGWTGILSVSYVTRESETGFEFEANRSGFTTFAFWLTRMEMGQ